MSVGLVVGVLLARYLGATQFGQLNYVLAFAALFAAIANLSLDGMVVRDLVREPDGHPAILGTAFVLRAGGSLLAFALTMAAILLVRPGDRPTHWLVGITAASLCFQAFDVIDLQFQAQVQARYSVWAKLAAFVALAVAKLTLILVHAPLVAFVVASAVEAAVGALGLVAAYRLTGGALITWRASVARARGLLRDAWPLALSGVMASVYMRIDQVLLGQFLDDRQVGIYAVAVRIAELWYFVPLTVMGTFLPLLVAARQQDEPAYRAMLQRLFTCMVAFSYLAALLTSLAAGPIVRLLYGVEYGGAAPCLAVMVWTVPFVSLGLVRSAWYVAENLALYSLLTMVAGAVANVALNLVLIPRHGVLGAAAAAVVCQALASYLATALARRGRGIFWAQSRALLLHRLPHHLAALLTARRAAADAAPRQ
jgi:polysaccharide transporter, PST family